MSRVPQAPLAENYEQGSLFMVQQSAIDQDLPASYIYTSELQPAPTPELEAASDTQGGVSVNIIDYYAALNGLATLASRLNTSTNFLIQTSDPSSGSFRQIEQRLIAQGEDIELKIGKAQDNQSRLTKASKTLFAKELIKMDEMTEAGLTTPEEAKQIARSEFTDLTQKYFDPHNSKQLQKFKRHVAKRLKQAQKLEEDNK